MARWWTGLGVGFGLLGALALGASCYATPQEPQRNVATEKSENGSESSNRKAGKSEEWNDRENSVGLHLLKHIEGLSDEAVCERWERDPYMQYFCGEEYFQHAFPLERSGMTHFRNRVGDEALETLLQETLAAAHRAGALSVRATEAVAVDTTVQEKAIAHPTEHGLLLAAIEQVGAQAKKAGLQEGDIILAINGDTGQDMSTYQSLLRTIGPRVKILVRRSDGTDARLFLKVQSIL